MKAPMFQVDAFTGEGLAGNRAAVCLIDHWPADASLQAVAARNGFSETAFLVSDVGATYDLRWFTPTTEVDLCGHATLASAHVVFAHLQPGATSVSFKSRSGVLGVERRGEILTLDFPVRPAVAVDRPMGLMVSVGLSPKEVLGTPHELLLVYECESDIRVLDPDFDELRTLDRPGTIVTAPGDEVDFVSRFFAPSIGVDEDPVTGAAHCVLTPYWAARLGKKELHARQVSEQGGELFCEERGERVRIGGRARPHLEGVVEI